MKDERQTLYRLTWSHESGTHWLAMKRVHPAMSELAIPLAEADDPGAHFVVADKPPAITPALESKARHVANAF
ncbi:hypothetical protein EXN61_21910 [Agrobacterium tumefaciens]|uniref:Uncharacterized protein n=1 Tax=Agrobacterium tumefaciens TaxID=358 RepID=A0A546XS07_AGRTU|nr:hypothetical protein [Agrobacterium tumefaciens]TRB03514.1 hypothetical protein EXN61_21910 [Agrobacterium tumefaciens]